MAGIQGQGFHPQMNRKNVSGVSFPRSQLAPKDVTDGLSHMYLVGERARNTDDYSFATFEPDRGHPSFAGGWLATAYWPPMRDPVHIEPNVHTFGSSHPGGWLMAFCDGSVQSISYELDAATHRRLANRSDGLAASAN